MLILKKKLTIPENLSRLFNLLIIPSKKQLIFFLVHVSLHNYCRKIRENISLQKLFSSKDVTRCLCWVTAKKMKISIKDLVTFTEGILNWKLHFLCSRFLKLNPEILYFQNHLILCLKLYLLTLLETAKCLGCLKIWAKNIEKRWVKRRKYIKRYWKRNR